MQCKSAVCRLQFSETNVLRLYSTLVLILRILINNFVRSGKIELCMVPPRLHNLVEQSGASKSAGNWLKCLI